MTATFRTLLDDLRTAGELTEISKPVDIRHIATLVDQADTALLFRNVIGHRLQDSGCLGAHQEPRACRHRDGLSLRRGRGDLAARPGSSDRARDREDRPGARGRGQGR